MKPGVAAASQGYSSAREGLEGRCADPATGELRPVSDLLAELVPRCTSGSSEVDFAGTLLETLRHNGCGATRQREALRGTGQWHAVLAMLVNQNSRDTT